MKARIGKRGPEGDYLGAHVTLKHGERILLGTIVYICPDEYLCHVRHFNGEMWPVNPALSRLKILERAYEIEDSGVIPRP